MQRESKLLLVALLLTFLLHVAASTAVVRVLTDDCPALPSNVCSPYPCLNGTYVFPNCTETSCNVTQHRDADCGSEGAAMPLSSLTCDALANATMCALYLDEESASSADFPWFYAMVAGGSVLLAIVAVVGFALWWKKRQAALADAAPPAGDDPGF